MAGATTLFNHIRILMLDFSQTGSNTRKEVANAARIVKIVSATVGVLSTLQILVSSVSLAAYPIIGGLGLILGTISLIISYEVYTISDNTQNLFDPSSNFNNILGGFRRLVNSLNVDWFTSTILKDTLVSDALFHSAVVKRLQQPA